jgi:hypothetical protein
MGERSWKKVRLDNVGWNVRLCGDGIIVFGGKRLGFEWSASITETSVTSQNSWTQRNNYCPSLSTKAYMSDGSAGQLMLHSGALYYNLQWHIHVRFP